MKIIVLSDTHSDIDNMEKIIKQYEYTADYFIHLGDYARDVSQIRRVYPSLNIIGIKGNGDYFIDVPETIYRDFCGIKFMLTHGHRFNVQLGVDLLVHTAKQNDCEYALFGHLHVSLIREISGVTLISPGSISCPRDGYYSYCAITIDEKTKAVDVQILEL